MAVKNYRPTNLSEWVFFGKQGTFSQLLGGDIDYINRVRANNRPVICIVQKPRGKYRWLVEFDCVEGFAIKTYLSDIGAVKAGEIAKSYPHKTISVLGKCYSYFCARYTTEEDAIAVANQLALLTKEDFQPRQ
ncbi:hypothetical protein A6770_40275 [Nostoc minutum NIES-26]|uniref:Uncharacterized protein n=1 Tax=Nostoc minutum NIES-26 TaxID=1844469 RepID=A0A367RN58_9NOSO|nr:hypothetical protein A6770_40275 [Nostoc minutum NIES-26]